SIIFSTPGIATGSDLWVLPLSGVSKPTSVLVSPNDEMHGNLSPDGQLIAYTSNASGPYEVFVQTFPRSERRWQVSTNGRSEPRCRADQREIYSLPADRQLMAVAIGPGPTFDVPKPLFQTRVPAGVSANRSQYVPSADGQRFLVNTQASDVRPT